MVRLLIVLLIFFAKTFSQVKQTGNIVHNPLSCTIFADSSVYHLRQPPRITVEIKNNTNNSLLLVRAIDGSDDRWRFPYVYFEIEKAGDSTYKTKSYGRCGNMDQIKSTDFIEILPSAVFNPYKFRYSYNTRVPDDNRVNTYAYAFKIMDSANFSTSGEYKITFYYSTDESDFKNWLGHGCEPFKNGEYENLINLFAKVPKTSVYSNTLIVKIL